MSLNSVSNETLLAAQERMQRAIAAEFAADPVAAFRRVHELIRRANATQAALQATPNPTPADVARAKRAQAAAARLLDRLAIAKGAARARENVQNLRAANRARLLALQARPRLRALRTLARLPRWATTRARQHRRSRRSSVRLARPAGRKRRRRSGDDDPARITGCVPATDGGLRRQDGAA